MPKFSAYMRGEGVKGDTGKNASFGEISATSHISNFPEVTISTSGPDDQKNINFDFGLVSGPSGGFSTNQNANIQFIEVGSLPSISITTDDTSPNNSKVFNFNFKIPEPKNIINIEQTILSTTSEGENEITISYNDNSFTTFIVHNGAQGTPSFIQGAVSTTLELPDNNNYTGQAFLVGENEENKKLYVYLENEWKYQGTISGAGFGEPTGSIEIISFTTSQIYMDDKVITLEKTEENNLEIKNINIYLEPMQSGTGDPSPNNIRPIVGWNQINIYHEEEYNIEAIPKITIDFNDIKYGGIIDVTNGIATITYGIKNYDGSNDENWIKSGTSKFFIEIDDAKAFSGKSKCICNQGKYVSSDESESVGDCFILTDNNVFFYYYPPLEVLTNVETYTTWLVQNPLQVVYPLATPQTIQLTPVELSLLLGENNIWTNAGVLELDCTKINEPQININIVPESPESAKIFDFNFKIPQGKPGKKGDTPIIDISTSVTTFEHDIEPTVSVTTLNENEFRFDFGIPVGYTPEMTATISTTDLPNGSIASATVSVEQNNLNFHFGIPQGLKGETGASINDFTFLSTNPETHGNIYYANFTDGTSTLFEVPEGPMGYGYYQKLPFTSTNIEESSQYTWIEESNGSSTLIINRTENDFIPVNIYNSTNNNIAATFTLATSTENYPFGSIQYNTNEKFDGILYYIGKAPVPQLRIGSVTTSSDGIASISTNKDGYDTILNFSFPIKGDKGDKGDKGEDGVDGKDGNGIASIQVLSVEGLTTNYRITFTDQTMTPFDFSVRNGKNGSGSGSGGGIDEVDLSDDSIILNTLPIEHGGTGASTSTQAWINLGGGPSGQHPDDYYIKSTDTIIPTLEYGDFVTSISTDSFVGVSTEIARSDHVHNISLTTGDENGQVKIAGVNIDVKGLDSAAYTATTNYYPSTGGNIPMMSVGGGERIDKISITNIDPGVGSELASNNILFVYTGSGGYQYYSDNPDCPEDYCTDYLCPQNTCFIDDCEQDHCYNRPCYGSCYNQDCPSNNCYTACYDSNCYGSCYNQDCPSNNCYTACYDSNCYGNCYSDGTYTVRIKNNDTYIVDGDGNLVRYGNADELVNIIGSKFIFRTGSPSTGLPYNPDGGIDLYYQIGDNQYIYIKAVDTIYTCPNNCYGDGCATDGCYNPNNVCELNCFNNPCYGNCYSTLPCQINECYDTSCRGNNCYVGTPCRDDYCRYEGCYSHRYCFVGTCYITSGCGDDFFYCNDVCNDVCFSCNDADYW